ncbi:DsbA family protein [Secundilactobacillus kimchicus]|uniref:DsbA family protein n=1 Tax=Secundilactobacillus kimchicus TaxID=528209 RepID=UPI0024A7F847|nr:DsbA family protein [Secundilactobacillus kimchicus]
MLEVYLFINPLGSRCMKSERSILRLAGTILDNISYQFIPLLSPKIIDSHLRNSDELSNDLTTRNEQFEVHYKTILDYKAALFQGKKRGRQFLMGMQDAIVEEGREYSDDLALEIAERYSLDLEMFQEDRRSPLAQKAFKADQHLAAEMKVESPSTAVIYNISVSDYGLLLDDVTDQTLYNICEDQGLLNQPLINHGKPNLRVL